MDRASEAFCTPLGSRCGQNLDHPRGGRHREYSTVFKILHRLHQRRNLSRGWPENQTRILSNWPPSRSEHLLSHGKIESSPPRNNKSAKSCFLASVRPVNTLRIRRLRVFLDCVLSRQGVRVTGLLHGQTDTLCRSLCRVAVICGICFVATLFQRHYNDLIVFRLPPNDRSHGGRTLID